MWTSTERGLSRCGLLPRKPRPKGVLQVCAHDGFRSFWVAGGDRLEELFVLFEGPAGTLGVSESGLMRPMDERIEPCGQFGEAGVPGGFVEHLVEPEGDSDEPIPVPLTGRLLHLGEEAVEHRELHLGGALGGEAGGEGVDPEPYFEHVLDLLCGHLPDDESSRRVVGHQALGQKARQGLTYGSSTHLQRGGEVRLVERLTAWEDLAVDGLPEREVGYLSGRHQPLDGTAQGRQFFQPARLHLSTSVHPRILNRQRGEGCLSETS